MHHVLFFVLSSLAFEFSTAPCRRCRITLLRTYASANSLRSHCTHTPVQAAQSHCLPYARCTAFAPKLWPLPHTTVKWHITSVSSIHPRSQDGEGGTKRKRKNRWGEAKKSRWGDKGPAPDGAAADAATTPAEAAAAAAAAAAATLEKPSRRSRWSAENAVPNLAALAAGGIPGLPAEMTQEQIQETLVLQMRLKQVRFRSRIKKGVTCGALYMSHNETAVHRHFLVGDTFLCCS